MDNEQVRGLCLQKRNDGPESMKEDSRTEDNPPVRPFVPLNMWKQESHVEQVPATGTAVRPWQPIGCTHRMAHRRNPMCVRSDQADVNILRAVDKHGREWIASSWTGPTSSWRGHDRIKTAFGQNHIWPQKETAFGELFFVTAFGQTAFGQKWCFIVLTAFGQNRIWCFGHVWLNVFLHWLGVFLCFVVVVCGISGRVFFWACSTFFWPCSTFFGRVQHFFGRVQHWWGVFNISGACSTFFAPPPSPDRPLP